MMRIIALMVFLLPLTALAAGAPEGGINWFTIGDPHNLAMGWFILNFLIFATGAFFVIKGPIMRQVRERAERFENLVKASERAREAAEKRQAELQAKLDGLSVEIESLRSSQQGKLSHEKDLIVAAAKSEIDRLQKNAEIALERQRRAAELRLTAEAARLAFDAAKARVETLVSDADHSRLNDEFVVKVGGEA